ncbi:MAG: hypothetical protein JNJ61_16545 [Anaerolineae bacterium]|nr:hypothetical protein [Anaerolineae bacterium]
MSSLFSTGHPSPTSRGALPPKPLPFHMTDPFLDRGVWCFWLTADEQVLQYTNHLNCVLNVSYMTPPFMRKAQNRALVTINPRYDAQEVWLWMYETLETEAHVVELNESWEDAIVGACVYPDEDDQTGDSWD